MSFRHARRLAAGFALGFTPLALACGVCVEDKVAAAYDHATATRALGAGRVLVFAEVVGEGDAAARVRSARSATAKVAGVDRASIRTSTAPAVVSFALDPRARSPEAALAQAQRIAGEARFSLALLKVLR